MRLSGAPKADQSLIFKINDWWLFRWGGTDEAWTHHEAVRHIQGTIGGQRFVE